MRLAFESLDSVKSIALPQVGGHHPNHWGLEQSERQRKKEFASFCILPACLPWNISSHPHNLRLECIPSALLISILCSQTELYRWYIQVSISSHNLRLEFTPSTPLISSFCTQTELYRWYTWVSTLQMADHGTSQPP